MILLKRPSRYTWITILKSPVICSDSLSFDQKKLARATEENKSSLRLRCAVYGVTSQLSTSSQVSEIVFALWSSIGDRHKHVKCTWRGTHSKLKCYSWYTWQGWAWLLTYKFKKTPDFKEKFRVNPDFEKSVCLYR